MTHGVHDEIGLELARHVAAQLRESNHALVLARENLARWSRQNGGSAALLRCYGEWEAILGRPVDEICEILCADTEEGRRLRQNSPFAGVLPAHAIWAIKQRIRHQHAAVSA